MCRRIPGCVAAMLPNGLEVYRSFCQGAAGELVWIKLIIAQVYEGTEEEICYHIKLHHPGSINNSVWPSGDSPKLAPSICLLAARPRPELELSSFRPSPWYQQLWNKLFQDCNGASGSSTPPPHTGPRFSAEVRCTAIRGTFSQQNRARS